MKINIELTWSKIVAVLILGCAFFLDMKYGGGGFNSFQFALPFIVLLITGKQYLDYRKNGNNA